MSKKKNKESKKAITIDMIRRVREATGALFVDCNKALVTTNGDEAKAITYLKEHHNRA